MRTWVIINSDSRYLHTAGINWKADKASNCSYTHTFFKLCNYSTQLRITLNYRMWYQIYFRRFRLFKIIKCCLKSSLKLTNHRCKSTTTLTYKYFSRNFNTPIKQASAKPVSSWCKFVANTPHVFMPSA